MFVPSRPQTPQRQSEALRRQGFTPEQIIVLSGYRIAYEAGTLTDDLPPDRHLVFARWLCQHGKISG
jgi:hypothetical protein